MFKTANSRILSQASLRMRATTIAGRSLAIVARPQFKAKYDNYINGKFVPPVGKEYFDNVSPIDGKVFCQAPRSKVKKYFDYFILF